MRFGGEAVLRSDARGGDRKSVRLDGRLLNQAEGAVVLVLCVTEGVVVTESDEAGGECQDREKGDAATERGALS
ncbi:MAG: hypothetical protein AAF481_12625 [Acidobacteriota bacterium]